MPNLALRASPRRRAFLLFPVGMATWPWEGALKDPGLSVAATESAKEVRQWGSSIQRGDSDWGSGHVNPFQTQWLITHPHFRVGVQVIVLRSLHRTWHKESLVQCIRFKASIHTYLLRHGFEVGKSTKSAEISKRKKTPTVEETLYKECWFHGFVYICVYTYVCVCIYI